MAEIKHNGGIVEAMVELGFDAVKYFEGTITGTVQNISISPPARRLTLVNRSSDYPVYLNVTGDDAAASASMVPGDNIKIAAGCQFEMDFDILENISLITAGNSVEVEALLGWKGIKGNC